MDLFGSDDDSDGEEVQRSDACGVLKFHNGQCEVYEWYV